MNAVYQHVQYINVLQATKFKTVTHQFSLLIIAVKELVLTFNAITDMY